MMFIELIEFQHFCGTNNKNTVMFTRRHSTHKNENVEQMEDDELFMIDGTQRKNMTNNAMDDDNLEEKDWIEDIKLQEVQQDNKKDIERIFIPLEPAWTDPFLENMYIQVDAELNEEESLEQMVKYGQNEQNKNIIHSFISKKDYEKADKLPDGQLLITGTQYEERMRQLYQKLHKTPDWAKLKTEQVISDDKSVIREQFKVNGRNLNADNNFGALTTDKVFDTSRQITKIQLDFDICPDVNQQERPSEVVSIRFHPHSNLLAALGSDKTVRLFQVSSDKSALVDRIVATDDTNTQVNNKNRKKKRKDLQSRFENGAASISGMEFTADGMELIMTSPKTRLFFVCDMTTGDTRVVGNLTSRVGGSHKGTKKGRGTHLDDSLLPIISCSPNNEIIAIASANNSIELLSKQTKFSIGQLMLGEAVRSLQFSSDSLTLYSTTKGGKVYLWDIRQQRPRHVFQDEGSIDTTCMSIFNRTTARNRLACGSTNGVVNVYDLDVIESNNRHPKPLGSIMNLTTTTTNLQFSYDGKLLALASKEKPNAMRMVHVESLSVYQHFPYKPSANTAHQFTVNDLHFNSDSQFMAVATGARVRLFQFPYYITNNKNGKI
jgi:U3 small nucleolar RNA-associated protein 18